MAKVLKDTSHLRLRVEATLLAKLEKAAEKNGRTLTGEIIRRLEESFAKEDARQQLETMVDRLADRFKEGFIAVKEGDRVVYKRIGDEK